MKKATTTKTLKASATKGYGQSIKDTFKDEKLSQSVVKLFQEEFEDYDENTIFTEDLASYFEDIEFSESGISNVGATRFLVKS